MTPRSVCRDSAMVTRLLKMWNDGVAVSDIARALDCAEGTVTNAVWRLRREGHPFIRRIPGRASQRRVKIPKPNQPLAGSVIARAVIYDSSNRPVGLMDPWTRQRLPLTEGRMVARVSVALLLVALTGCAPTYVYCKGKGTLSGQGHVSGGYGGANMFVVTGDCGTDGFLYYRGERVPKELAK